MRIMVCKQSGRTVGRLLAALVAVTVLGGCAMKGDVRDLQDEIRSLAARQDSLLAELRMETRSTRDTLRTQSDQMFDFRGDLAGQLRQIAEGIRTLQALAGQNQSAIAQLAGRAGVPAAGGAGATDPGGLRAGGGERLVGGGGGSADQLWSSAMQQYDRRSFNAAGTAFRQFLEENPSDPRAVDAHFYMADILSVQDQPAEALEAFLQIPSLYPTAQKVPDALYRIGVLQVELGRTDDARGTFERIVNTYPGTIHADIARAKLEEIG
jgi:tol-pal system protein YbgF